MGEWRRVPATEVDGVVRGMPMITLAPGCGCGVARWSSAPGACG